MAVHYPAHIGIAPSFFMTRYIPGSIIIKSMCPRLYVMYHTLYMDSYRSMPSFQYIIQIFHQVLFLELSRNRQIMAYLYLALHAPHVLYCAYNILFSRSISRETPAGKTITKMVYASIKDKLQGACQPQKHIKHNLAAAVISCFYVLYKNGKYPASRII